MPASEETQTRRSSGTVRELLLGAARTTFDNEGYGAKTKAIAELAGVAETAIYTQFGSKANLFRAAVVSSFTEAIQEWVTSWEGAAVDGDIGEMAHSYIYAVYDMAVMHKRILRELMTHEANDTTLAELAGEVSRDFANALGRVQRVVRLGAIGRGYPHVDGVSLAVTTSMVVSIAVFDDWFIPDESNDATRERLCSEMVSLVLHGITQRPAD